MDVNITAVAQMKAYFINVAQSHDLILLHLKEYFLKTTYKEKSEPLSPRGPPTASGMHGL